MKENIEISLEKTKAYLLDIETLIENKLSENGDNLKYTEEIFDKVKDLESEVKEVLGTIS